VRIPRSLNAALDRAATNTRLILIVLPLMVAAVAAAWLPALAAFAVGIGVGGVAVHVRMSARIARLHAEADDLLRENGALRHEKNMIAKTSVASGSVLTQKLPSIPGEEEGE
jgi:hypothetical protein